HPPRRQRPARRRRRVVGGTTARARGGPGAASQAWGPRASDGARRLHGTGVGIGVRARRGRRARQEARRATGGRIDEPWKARMTAPQPPLRLLYVVNNADFFVSHRLPLGLAALAAGYEVHVACPPSATLDALPG